MVYRPRQVVVRAQETAAELLRALEHDRLVEGFLAGYAKERPGRAAHSARYKELLAMIRREALLAMVARMDAGLPRRLGLHKRARLRPAEERAQAALLNLFREEFLLSLGQALDWGDQDLEDFLHDLDLYERLTKLELRPVSTRRFASSVAGPFVDRVGLMLDPAMLEKARRAAGKFQSQLEAASDGIVRTVFSRRRKN